MSQVLAGNPYTFQVLFVDEANSPIVVVDPRITVFTFSGAGVKQTLVANAPLVAAAPAEVGRYTYVYTVPANMEPTTILYAEMSGSDPNAGGVRILVEQSVTVVAGSAMSASSGLVASFIRR